MSKIYDKTAGNFKATTLDAKIIDAQKILVRPKGGTIDERVNILEAVETSLMGNIELFDCNPTTNTGETDGVSIQLDKEDFIKSGVYIKELSLPYKQGLNTEARYCHILVFDNVKQIQKITSYDTQTRQTGNSDLLVSTWHFNNVLMPDYKYVRIALSSSATLPITGDNATNCSKFRINVCRNQNNQNIIPTNLSKIYNANGSTNAYLGWVQVKYAEHALTQIGEMKEQIESVSNDLNTFYSQDKNRYYSQYSTGIFQEGVENVASLYTSSVRFGSTHMPKGFIKKVSLYGRDANSATHDSKTNGCYLIAKIYKKATGELVRSYSSTNGKVKVLEKQSGSSERPLNTWEFDGFESIAEDEIIKFYPSSDGETLSSTYYFGVAVDNTHTHDDCQVGGDGDANNPLATGVKNLALAVFEGFFYYDLKKEGLKEYEKNFLQSLYTTTTESVFDNNIDNLADENIGVGNIRGFILERPYISNCSFNEIRWVSKGSLSSTTRIKATLRDRRGKRLESYVSDNEESFGTEGQKSFRFTKDIEVTDDIGSIVFETCDAAGVISTSQIRTRVIGNAVNNNAGGSEVTNNNFIIHVIFYGKVAQASDALITEEEKAALQQLVQGTIAVKEITIVDDDANAVSLLGENYEEIDDEGIVLKFEDSLDNNYLMCSEKDLVDATDYLELDVNINCPEELGKKLVRRYLVIDLRNMDDERNIVTIFPENIRWSSQTPVIQANNFYVISFQRFAKDLIIANVEVYLAE